MKVLHLSTWDTKGGAARAAYRLHSSLHRAGYTSSMFVLHRQQDDTRTTTLTPSRRLGDRVRRQLRRERIEGDFKKYRSMRQPNLELFSDDRTAYADDIRSQLPQAEIVNLHWISGFVDLGVFFGLVPVPVVWTLHDMNAFTGGCHYDLGCQKYTGSCGACPQLGSAKVMDLSRHIWARKERLLKRISSERLHIVAPSHWLAEEAKCSSLLNPFSISVIPYGLDTNVFAPRNKRNVRELLGITEDRKVLLLAAQSTTNQRKGFSFLAEALKDLNSENLLLLSLGSGQPNIEANVSHIHLGEVTQDWVLAMAYSAADLFVIPSLQDNLPNTVMESLACGTPVVGFNVGGIPDMVRPGSTGYLAPVGDVRALRQAIVQLLRDDEKRIQMSTTCRQVALKEYSLPLQAERYMALYSSMLAQSRVRQTEEL